MAATPPPPVAFAALPAGWHVFSDGDGAYATSWAYRENSFGWAASMPRGGIVVRVFFPPGAKAPRPALRLVVPKAPATTLEGVPDTPEYRLRGRVAGRDAEVWIDVRRPRPTPGELRTIRRVLAAIRFA